MSRNAGSGVDDPCECGVQDPERESNKQPASAPLPAAPDRSGQSFGASSRRAVAKRKPFSGGWGSRWRVRRRGVEWGRRGGGAHHLEARGRLQRVDRRGRLSGVILSIWRIESEQAKRRVGGQSRRRRAIMSEGYKVRGATPRHPSRSASRAPARPLPRVAARHGPARLHHFPAMCFAPALPVSECALCVVEQTGFAEST